tara:strand:- start:583 stop:1011 length:429 start_codon:yes stop_codon:yes gene_type:complete
MKYRKKRGEEREMDMTPMIDIVFQLIIFFIVTINLEKDKLKPIELAPSPEGPAIEKKDPRMVVITVDKKGEISIGSVGLSAIQLQGVMQNAVNLHGFGIPVLVRGDRKTLHAKVRLVMDACASVGIWKIKFAAMKEKVTPPA